MSESTDLVFFSLQCLYVADIKIGSISFSFSLYVCVMVEAGAVNFTDYIWEWDS